MPLSITCACGARLEIDEAFAGKIVPCPDCNAPLPVALPPDLGHPRISGMALASVAVGLVGMFTLVGSVAALLLGYASLRWRIRPYPERYAGVPFARAGIVLGAAGLLLTLVGLVTPWTFGLDRVLREFYWAGKLEYGYALEENQLLRRPGQNSNLVLAVPSPEWGLVPEGDGVLLVNVRLDAQLGVRSINLDGDETDERCREKAQAAFLQSQLVNLVGRLHNKPPTDAGTMRDLKQLPGQGKQEFLLDLRLGGLDRTFLIRLHKDVTRLTVLAGGARKQQFASLEDTFRKTFESMRQD